MIWLAVAIAGAAGAVARHVLDTVLAVASRSAFPWRTSVINVSGSLLAGAVTAAVARGLLEPAVATVVAGGFLGAYTTFSTAMYQTARLLDERAHWTAVANLVAPLLAATGAAAVGFVVASRLLGA